MFQRGSTFLLFVTLLLAVVVPFCCCNFHSWLSVCVPCEAPPHLVAVKPLAQYHEHASAHEHESDHHAEGTKSSTNGNEPSPSPCGPGHDHDDCTCGKNNTLLTIAKPNLEFPMPILVSILSFPTIRDSEASSPPRTPGRDLRVAFRPSATLLRLHCALIV